MAETTCEVSILIPVYNARAFVGQAIESALRQTHTDLEVIVVDDASTDGSDQVVAAAVDSRIRRFRNTANLGLVGNWNESLRHARGRFITMLHQDDVMEPANLERKLSVLRGGDVAWVASDCLQINASGNVIHEHWFQHHRALRMAARSREAQFSAMFLGRNYLCFPTIMWSREVTDRLGGFENKGGYCVDIYMWLKFLSRYRLAYLDERLVRYRWAQNESLKYKDEDWLLDEFDAKRQAAKDLSLPSGYALRLKALYGPRFLRRYLTCRLRGDRKGVERMRRGLAALRA